MIKILFHIDTLSGGGAEKVLCNLVNNMNTEEFDITVQTLYKENHQKFLNSNIHYKYIYPKSNKVYSYIYRVEAALGLVYRLHMKGDYDIECAYLECGPTKVLASSTNKKARKIAWVHCDIAVAFGKEFATKTAKWYKKYDEIVCVSNQVKSSFESYFGTNFKTTVLHNVVDSEEIIQKSKDALPPGLTKTDFTMVSVARLTAPKNLLRLVKSFKTLKDNGITSKLWIVGEGEDRAKLEAYINANNLLEDIFLLGFQRNPYPFIKAGDLMVCSSDYEGFSTFITESLILGKPVITTDCSGMRELLGDSEYGIITENNDHSFYDGLKEIITHKEKIIPLIQKKAEIRGQEFTTKKLTYNNEKFLKGE